MVGVREQQLREMRERQASKAKVRSPKPMSAVERKRRLDATVADRKRKIGR